MDKVSSSWVRIMLALVGVWALGWGTVRGAEPTEPVALAAAPAVIPNSECLDCHEAEFKARKRGQPKEWVGVRPEIFTKSVHGKINCVDCHASITEPEHPSKLPPAQCASCHADAVTQFNHSIHGVSHEMGSSDAATCASCHGTHDMVPVKQADSPVFVFNLAKTCAKCHDDAKITKDYRMGQSKAEGHYLDSIHGRALVKMGLVVAPTCNDCHGVHDIKRSVDKESHTNHANIAKSCGTCHLGIEDTYKESVHGQLLLKGDKQGPVCTDCHSAHDIEKPANAHFKANSDQSCGKCHEDRLEHYRETYHGKAMALGQPNVASDVAACYDCHGHHDVFPVSDPRSRLSKDQILTTCQQCHPGVGPKFTEYQPHANPLDKENYPILNKVFWFMTSLLIGVFSFFGLHTAFWLFRSIYLYLHDTKTFRAAVVQTHVDDENYTRFTPFERFLHLMMVTSFLALVITGMPLKFYYTDWAKLMFRLLGNAEVARTLHHYAAVVTFAYFGLHLGALVRGFWRNRGGLKDPVTGKFTLARLFGIIFHPDSMVPSPQDWRDFIAHQKWFFGKGPKPQFDRWTYWERFDYFAVFWGVAIIGFSGLIMWFPGFFTQFLPGWVINIALVVHSDEALLAAGFIFSFHFFNTHFRIEKFPMDTVIFSGRISKTEMLHERKRWYDRLVAAGRLEVFRVKSDDWEGRKHIAKTWGFIFFGTGLILLALIVYAMVSRLVH
ncbi:formate dehydrogenase-O subunit gamma [Lacunisphaera limnophila]|uniref:Formate dehydrogenase-O subunit gamma n=1 Tax=Lacunisphaera limnophila TaxID=1838286 RepID=A0A1D8AZC6_9BACT|nr:cytochrome c3 family protein [Lacunisphaera limnophila]AOS46243.1 formate dehydrogenase-O subunit gamma [Lacunisphaera limnophila]